MLEGNRCGAGLIRPRLRVCQIVVERAPGTRHVAAALVAPPARRERTRSTIQGMTGRQDYVRIIFMEEVRVTVAVAQLLREFAVDPTRPRYGYDLMQSTGFASGKMYPILLRLKGAGIIEDEMESVDRTETEGPARKMYKLSPFGAVFAAEALAGLAVKIGAPVPSAKAVATPDGGRP
jgi:PadR family transcriptional regulator, regulatory protein PadR